MTTRLAFAAASLLALLATQPVLAKDQNQETPQQAQDSECRGNGDILVTAQTLEERQITDIANLGNIVPNATFRKSVSKHF